MGAILDGADGERVQPHVTRENEKGTGTAQIPNPRGVAKTAADWDLIRKPNSATQGNPAGAHVSDGKNLVHLAERRYRNDSI